MASIIARPCSLLMRQMTGHYIEWKQAAINCLEPEVLDCIHDFFDPQHAHIIHAILTSPAQSIHWHGDKNSCSVELGKQLHNNPLHSRVIHLRIADDWRISNCTISLPPSAQTFMAAAYANSFLATNLHSVHMIEKLS